ncbi:MAG: tetratricopeptide repeat protein [Tannerella sp.]|jgi:tetratricopeptide (TPR) repeat protein|nr:tetratricopeptide repeat protein [Tannerella sp.]
MTTKEIETIHERAVLSLDNRGLKTAFDTLQEYFVLPKAYPFLDELNDLQYTYRQLLHYYSQGSKDPLQSKIRNDITASAYELADKMKQTLLTDYSSKTYYRVRRENILPASVRTIMETVRSSSDNRDYTLAGPSIAQLFKHIWASPYLSEDDAKILHNSIKANSRERDDIREYDQLTIFNCQIVSALILGLQELFDRRKMILLFEAAESAAESVKLRAFTGILLTLFLYRNRIGCYAEIHHRLDNLTETAGFGKIVYMIIQRFILSRETEKISNKLRDEILPEMIKMNPKFNPNITLKNLSEDDLENNMNPEWMDKLADSPLGKKLEEFNKLQEEGADVMHSTFVHLKNFPFFREMSNWFIPFDRGLLTITEDDAIIKSLEIITNIGLMCNSDLYSLYFSMKQIPEKGRQMMIGQLESQLVQVKRQKTAELQTRDNRTERIVGQYIQDLYRFYKLYQYRGEFGDIFAERLDFHNLPILKPYFSNSEDLVNIAEHYLRKNYFEDALVIYERLEKESDGDEMLYQKTGYCRQMMGDYEGALSEYAKAELMNPDNKWLLQRSAQCCRRLKLTEQAIDYYLRYEKIEKENLSALLNIGSCYLEMKNYNEALKYYFKVDYLDRDGVKAWRPIAWCSFLTGKYDHSRNYYNKILSHQPETHDYMNAGHTEWALQNISGAIEFYRKSLQAAGSDYEKFRSEFERDIPELAAAGIDVADIPLLLDKVLYPPE